MFRQSARHCARQARSLALPALRVSAHSPALRITRQAPQLSSRVLAPYSRVYSLSSRLYSSEAGAAVADVAEPTENNHIEAFADLQQLGVDPNLLSAITRGLKYENMTPVQAKTINPALKGTDIVAQAKTGTGKTIAFLLPLLQRMIEEDPTLARRDAARRARSDDIRGIVLSPTRELAEQIGVEARRLCQNTGLVVQVAVGGTNKANMLRQTQRQGCHLLIATPGRLNDLLQNDRADIAAPNLAALVLDEADRMLDTGFEMELQEILENLPDKSEKVRQTMLVSATIPDNVIRLARTMVRADDFEFVQTIPESESLTHDRVPQHVVAVSSWTNVFPSLFELMDREVAARKEDPSMKPFKAIVYFNTTSLVEAATEISFARKREGLLDIGTFGIHSKLTQMQRTRSADVFRRARSAVLYSSDVTARGMDFPDVTHVIQIDFPRDRESYIHRLGRTGRQDKEGQGWLFLPPSSIQSARKTLSGLPIQANKSLESAEVEVNPDDLPEYHRQFRSVVSTLPRSMLVNAYTSLFGVAANKAELAEDLYEWTKKGWGWEAPPVVSSNWARLMGLPTRFLNVGDTRSRSSDDSSSDGRGSRFGGGRREMRRGSDAFDSMKGMARRDDRGGSRSKW